MPSIFHDPTINRVRHALLRWHAGLRVRFIHARENARALQEDPLKAFIPVGRASFRADASSWSSDNLRSKHWFATSYDFASRTKWSFLALIPIFAGTCADAREVLPMNLDSMHAAETVRRELPLRNDSQSDLIIVETRSSCSCLQVIRAPRSIAPKSSASILIECRPPSPGRKSLELQVDTLGETDRQLTYRWEGVVLNEESSSGSHGDVELEGLLCNADKVIASVGKVKGFTLVDGRSPAEFNGEHVIGAMNIPLRMLRNLNSLRDGDLVIYGSGSDDRKLLREANTLSKSGFKSIRVLNGGFRGWIASGHPVAKSGGDGVSGALIEPQAFYAIQSDEWLVLNVGNGRSQGDKVIAGAIEIHSEPSKNEDFLAEIRRHLKSKSGEFKVLFTSQSGEFYEVIETKIMRSVGVSVFYLNGGRRGYQRLLDERNAALNTQQLTLSSERDGARGSTTVIDSTNRGCGTCP